MSSSRSAKAHSNFDYQPTLTRPEANWTGRTGRVQPHAFELLGERRDLDVYICGLREMVDDLRLQLKERGFDRSASFMKNTIERREALSG